MPADPVDHHAASSTRWLLGLTLLALLVRAAFLLLEPATHPVADELTWTNWAIEGLLSDRVSWSPFRTNMIFYPPLYVYFIAVPYSLFSTLTAVKWAQIVVSALIVPAIGLVALRTFGRRAGVLAAFIAAFYPELVWFSVHFWSETLFMLFLWWGMERLLSAEDQAGLGQSVAAGGLFGLAILTRETVLYFLPFAALWLGLGRRRGARARGATFLLVGLVCVAPWTYRNWVQFHTFIPVSTAGGLNLYQGNAPLTRQEVYDRYHAVQGRAEQYEWARREGIRAILERQPLWLFEKLRDQMPNFWEADSLALIHIKRVAYGCVGVAPARAAAVVVLLPYLLVLASAIAGVVALRLDRKSFLLLLLLVFYNGLHVATHGFARYRLPVLPIVMILAASAWSAWSRRSYPRLGRRRLVLAAVLSLATVACLVPSFKMNYDHPAFGFAPPNRALYPCP
jgi:4-amino-4-deoxy-L-arabinose transferase-like glycosyltransferase